MGAHVLEAQMQNVRIHLCATCLLTSAHLARPTLSRKGYSPRGQAAPMGLRHETEVRDPSRTFAWEPSRAVEVIALSPNE